MARPTGMTKPHFRATCIGPEAPICTTVVVAPSLYTRCRVASHWRRLNVYLQTWLTLGARPTPIIATPGGPAIRIVTRYCSYPSTNPPTTSNPSAPTQLVFQRRSVRSISVVCLALCAALMLCAFHRNKPAMRIQYIARFINSFDRVFVTVCGSDDSIVISRVYFPVNTVTHEPLHLTR